MPTQINFLLYILVSAPGILIATTAHEFTRAAVSAALGDNIPKSQGRLTLNPIKHFEPIGFMMLLLTGGFGWGKPVETSALYYKDRKRGTLMTAIMPSIINLLLGMLFLSLQATVFKNTGTIAGLLLTQMCYYNVALAIFNLLPISPMDGTKLMSVFMPANKYFKYIQNEKNVQMIFLLLLFFGLFGSLFQNVTYFVIELLSKIMFLG